MQMENNLESENRGEKELNNKFIKFRWIAVIALLLFLAHNPIYAQILCETEPATTDGNIQNSNRLLDAIIIGISIVIVLFTLVMSVKYLFKPGENGQDHIKNIVRDEGF